MTGSPFVLVTRDELWSLGSDPVLLERRLIHGMARQDDHEIVASDRLDDECDRLCNAAMESARGIILDAVRDGTVRLIVSTSRNVEDRQSCLSNGRTGRIACPPQTEVSCSLTVGSLSLISDPSHIAADVALLATLAGREPAVTIDYRGVPILWRNGSAAVLLHEAAGHAAEFSHAPIAWPSWLSVLDRDADLLRGEAPSTMRRASFADVPLPRMSHVVARQSGAHFDLPKRRLDVHLVAGGRYEPLSEMVTIEVSAADLVDGDSVRAVKPFVIEEWRGAIAKALAGAAGEPLRYPGVVCSREGQDVVVGSEAPLILTVF